MAQGCIYISCFERAARSGSGRDSVRGSVGAMNAKLSRPDGLATVQSGRKQAQSRVCTPGFRGAVMPQATIGPNSYFFSQEDVYFGLALLPQWISTSFGFLKMLMW